MTDPKRNVRLSPGMKEHLELIADLAGPREAAAVIRDELVRKLFPTKEDGQLRDDMRASDTQGDGK